MKNRKANKMEVYEKILEIEKELNTITKDFNTEENNITCECKKKYLNSLNNIRAIINEIKEYHDGQPYN